MDASLDNEVAKLIELRKQLDGEVKHNVKAAQKRQKEHYDRKHQRGSFKVGQMVSVRNMKKLSKKGDKMTQNWSGPYEIAECIGRDTYRLKNTKNMKCLKSSFSSTRLKPCYVRGNIITSFLAFIYF